ncbi:hypothetical protein MLD38_032079 [Melastoma candidum]|uniref:Uncharacterized protein n=1 Tax=Melastoma candidum TaxID=119954 RepID=A0ACB9M4S3_9MYRT|nr:hypothetical protein MLD38_032079 [Melastoma candidum]
MGTAHGKLKHDLRPPTPLPLKGDDVGPSADPELDSYESACQDDAELRAFDTNLRTKTGLLIRRLAAGVEVRAMSLASLKETTECLLDMEQDVVKVILGCKTDIWKTPELFDLVEEYFENSLLTLDFLSALDKCLKRTRDSQLLILVALQQFDREEAEGKEPDGKRYARTLEELNRFREAGDPFTDEFFAIFRSVYSHQMATLEKLQSRKTKLDRKMKYIQAWRKVSGVIFATTVAAVIICSVVAAAVAAPAVTAALAAATALPIGSAGKWIDSVLKKHESMVGTQKDAATAMTIGTRMAIWDLDTIKALVEKLEISIDDMVRTADLAVTQEAVMLCVKEMRNKLTDFMKSVDELGMQADKCGRDIRRARTVVLQRIIKNPNATN